MDIQSIFLTVSCHATSQIVEHAEVDDPSSYNGDDESVMDESGASRKRKTSSVDLVSVSLRAPEPTTRKMKNTKTGLAVLAVYLKLLLIALSILNFLLIDFSFAFLVPVGLIIFHHGVLSYFKCQWVAGHQ